MEESNKDQLKLYSGKSGMTVDMRFSPLMRLSLSVAIILIPCIGLVIAIGSIEWGLAQIISAFADMVRAQMGH